MKIGLGTAQFGLDYGVTNLEGRTPQDEVGKILAVASANGIEVIDTAAYYGDSETVLGRTLPPEGFKLITKTPSFAGRVVTTVEAEELEQIFQRSLKRLRRTSVYALLAHHADDLLGKGGEILMARMKALKAAGLVGKIGASVYDANQIDGLLASCDFDLIQLPINLLDQRLVESGHLMKLKERGVEIHARSVFLQGLLLMAPQELPPYFTPIRAHLEACHSTFAETGVSPLAASLGFVQEIEEIDAIICGVNNHRQLEEICAAARAQVAFPDWRAFALNDARYINAANWKLQ